MFSEFVNRFRKSDEDELRAFQRSVLAIVNKLYPEKNFRIADDSAILLSGETKFGLTNIHSNYIHAEDPDTELNDIVKEHFELIFSATNSSAQHGLDWESAKKLLMPQLMPSEFTRQVPLVHKPFSGNILIGYVLDLPASYSYVTDADFERWGITFEELASTAIANLEERSKGIEITAFEGTNSMLFVGAGDGFDAVRIISPRMQQIAAENVGDPFYFGVPNRDFLACWSVGGESEFLGNMREKVRSDSETMPYPLCGEVLTLNHQGIPEIVEVDDDPRAVSAINN